MCVSSGFFFCRERVSLAAGAWRCRSHAAESALRHFVRESKWISVCINQRQKNTCNVFYERAQGTSATYATFTVVSGAAAAKKTVFSPRENDKSAKLVQWAAVLEAALWASPSGFTWDTQPNNEQIPRLRFFFPGHEEWSFDSPPHKSIAASVKWS